MSLNVTFCGAARTVTGSQYFLEYQAPNGQKFKFCIDSGLFQTGQKINLFKINSHLLFDPRKLDALVLTHAHLDHCGRIPYLVKHGFGGKIYSTPATKAIAEVVMSDAARLNTDQNDKDQKPQKVDSNTADYFEMIFEELSRNAGFNPLKGVKKSSLKDRVNKIQFDKEYHQVLARQALETENIGLYDIKDVEQTMTRFETYNYHQKFLIHPNLEIEFFDAGHILGSAYLTITEISSGKQVVFSGDFGNKNKPIINDPEKPHKLKKVSHIFIETTYGNRLHGKLDPKERLRKIIYETVKGEGKVILPSFSVERAQEVIYYIVELMQENKLPKVPIFLDSPMASKVLEICLDHPDLYDEKLRQKIANNANPLIHRNIKILSTPAQSKSLNNFDKPCIIIAGSGMMNGGRILKHLQFHIQNPKNTLLMVGYQAVGTLGRQIWDGAKKVEIEGMEYEVKTRVENINEFSAHGDQKILKEWVVDIMNHAEGGDFKTRLFLMHGEKDASLTFGKELDFMLSSSLETYWPHFGEQVKLWD